jgi:hypothetical protein
MYFRQKVAGFMKSLREGLPDEIVYTAQSGEGPIGEIDLVLTLPEELIRRVKLELKPGCSGKPIPNSEMVSRYPSELGFDSLGYRAEGWQSGVPFGVDVKLRG